MGIGKENIGLGLSRDEAIIKVVMWEEGGATKVQKERHSHLISFRGNWVSSIGVGCIQIFIFIKFYITTLSN